MGWGLRLGWFIGCLESEAKVVYLKATELDLVTEDLI